MIVSTSSKVPSDDSFSGSIKDKESKLYYSNHFPKLVVIYVCVLQCKSKVFLGIVAMIVIIKQDDNNF